MRRRRDRKKDEGAPCWESVSESPLRSREHRLRRRAQSQSPFLPHFPYIIPNFPVQMNNFTGILFSHIAPILPRYICRLLSLCLSHSLGAIFTSKRLHYLPSLRAIRNGVTLSCRHGRCFITPHPLSWEPFVEAPDIDGEDTGASSVHPPLHIPPSQPLLLTGKLWSKRCVIKWQSKQDLFGHMMGLAGNRQG